MTDTAPQFKSGVRLRSAACTTQIIVVKAPTVEGAITCGGLPMLELDQPGPPDGGRTKEAVNGSVMGKRYTDDTNSLEVLCTRAGIGDLGFAGKPLTIKSAKPLPASD